MAEFWSRCSSICKNRPLKYSPIKTEFPWGVRHQILYLYFRIRQEQQRKLPGTNLANMKFSGHKVTATRFILTSSAILGVTQGIFHGPKGLCWTSIRMTGMETPQVNTEVQRPNHLSPVNGVSMTSCRNPIPLLSNTPDFMVSVFFFYSNLVSAVCFSYQGLGWESSTLTILDHPMVQWKRVKVPSHLGIWSF